MGPNGCPETSVRNYNCKLRKFPEERECLLEMPLISSEVLTGGRHSHSESWLKSRHVKLAYITVNLTCTSPASVVGYINPPKQETAISLRSNNWEACHAAA